MSQLKVNSIVPVGGVSTGAFGGIIQVVPAFTTASTSVSSTTPVAINGLTVTITPSSTNSKFLIMASMTLGHDNQATAILLDLMRNGSKIAQGVNATQGACTSLLHFGAEVSGAFNYSYQHVDETTLSDLSDITYSYQFATSGQGTAKVNQRGNGTDLTSTANLIVCEVSG
tara:strand:+ start:37 stop:549 length:513 start_codon:yes stop_codon:yes gene_type:complete